MKPTSFLHALTGKRSMPPRFPRRLPQGCSTRGTRDPTADASHTGVGVTSTPLRQHTSLRAAAPGVRVTPLLTPRTPASGRRGHPLGSTSPWSCQHREAQTSPIQKRPLRQKDGEDGRIFFQPHKIINLVDCFKFFLCKSGTQSKPCSPCSSLSTGGPANTTDPKSKQSVL